MYHYISTGSARPVKSPPRRHTPQEQHAERCETDMLKLDSLKESAWASQPVMVPTPDGAIPVLYPLCAPKQYHREGLLYPSPDSYEQQRRLAGCEYKFGLGACRDIGK